MQCPSAKCQSTNVQFLPHYWESLPGDSPLKARYAEPAEVDGRARLVAAGIAVLGVIFLVTGGIAAGLLMLAAGGVGAMVTTGRIQEAVAKRAAWDRTQICLACTHLWVP